MYFLLSLVLGLYRVFCERNMLSTMVELFHEAYVLGESWYEIQVQILQTVSILLMNINNQRSLCK